jgi:hypothetical protein
MAMVESGATDTRPEADSGKVVVARTSPEDMQERELYVAVDGQRRGILRYGDSLTLPVSPGHHQLRVHNTISRRYAEFEIADGQQVCFRAANVRGKGFAMLAMFFGIAPMYTVLERQDSPTTRNA